MGGVLRLGLLALTLGLLLTIPIASLVHLTSQSSATCNAKSRPGQAVPSGARVGIVIAARRPDVAWVQRAVDSVRASANAAVLLYRQEDDEGGRQGEAAGQIAEGGAVTVRRVVSGAKGREAAAYMQAIVDEWDRLPLVAAFLHDGSNRHRRVPNDWVLQQLLRRPPAALPGGYLAAQCWPAGGEHGFRLAPANISANPAWRQPAARHLAQAWDEYFGRHLGPLPPAIAAPCCSEFVASRAAIRRHPKRFYSGARDWLAATAMTSDQAAHALEHAWHLLLQPLPQLPSNEQECLCALYGVPAVRAIDSRLLALLAMPPALAALHALRTTAWPLLRPHPTAAPL